MMSCVIAIDAQRLVCSLTCLGVKKITEFSIDAVMISGECVENIN